MPTVKRSNPNAFATLSTRCKELASKVAKAGWPKAAYYEDGTSVAYVATIQEFGVTIAHPGGTPYKVGPDGAVFVRKDSPDAAGLPVTKPHEIVIPPRPMLRPTVAKNKSDWKMLWLAGARAIVAGKATATQVMQMVSARAAGDIKKTIASITTPPLAKSTIAARRRQLYDRKTVGALDKPLVHEGIMFGAVTNTVEDAQQ
jgi:hypothetical protein